MNFRDMVILVICVNAGFAAIGLLGIADPHIISDPMVETKDDPATYLNFSDNVEEQTDYSKTSGRGFLKGISVLTTLERYTLAFPYWIKAAFGQHPAIVKIATVVEALMIFGYVWLCMEFFRGVKL